MKAYGEMNNATNADTRTMEFIRCRMAGLEQEQKLGAGQWVDFQPKDDQDPNWVMLLGKTRVLPDGALEVESGPGGHYLYSRVRVGPDFEVKGEFEVVRSSTRSFQAGLVMGTTDYYGSEWNSFRIKRNEDEGDLASFAQGWSRGITNAAPLKSDRNTFDFSLHGGKADITVNGTAVLTNSRQPKVLNARNDSCLLGLGAFNDVNNTVIRYRNVRVRRLAPAGQ
jgi:hypothetical protein